jgi:GNAT superfamily N-acetyltransferase
MARIRSMTPDDVPAAAQVGGDAFARQLGAPPDGARLDWLRFRSAHLLASDPGGAWVADEDGAVVGASLAVLRDGVWGLSWLVVRPDRQSRGIGRELLEATLGYGAPHRGGIILASTDPRAMRRYARAGFDLRPTVAASGIVDRRRLPAGLRAREAEPDEAAPVAAAAGRAARGAPYSAEDLALHAYGAGARVFVLGDAGLAVHRDEECVLLAAGDEDTARDLLWTCLAAAPPGGTYGIDFLTAGQDWAIGVALDAGLALTPDGPVFTRGDVGPLRPFKPSGALL